MNTDDVLQVELLKLRVAVGRARGWHPSSVGLLKKHQDPLEAYRAARLNERTIRASKARGDPMHATEIILDDEHQDTRETHRAAGLNELVIRVSEPHYNPILAREIIRDRTLIQYMIGLGNIIFALWIVVMLLIIA